MRRFLRQEMVIEVVRSVQLYARFSPPPPDCSHVYSYLLPMALPALPLGGALGGVPTLPLPLSSWERALTPPWAWLSPWALWAGGQASGPESCLGPHRRQLAARRTGPSSCSRTSLSAPL